MTQKNEVKSLEKIEELEEEYQEYVTDSHYDFLHKKIINYLVSGKLHSTLIGIIINLDGDQGKKDMIEATRFADYIINLLKNIN